jgi:beta-galactosidase
MANSLIFMKISIRFLFFAVAFGLACCGAKAQNSTPVFHFDFKDAAGKREVADESGKFRVVSETAELQVERGALRIAPGARLSIPAEGLPDLSRAMTASAWIFKSSTPDVTPILMKGVHPQPIQFLFSIGWRYPVFSYKNEPNQNFWKGIYYDGYFGSSIKYHEPSWMAPGAQLVETGGKWYHVASTFNAGAVRLYVNGALVAQHTAEKEELLLPNNEPLYVGIEMQRRQGKLEPYASANMLLNDLRLYDHALSAEEISREYSGDRPRYPSQLMIPPGKTHTSTLEPNYTYLGPEYDPLFQRKLKITQEYEKRLPSPDTGKGGAAVRWKNGQPELVINGQTEYPMAFVPAPLDYGTNVFQLDTMRGGIRDFAAADVNLIGVDVFPQRFWQGDGQYDWEKFDEFFEAALKANPQARIIAGLPLYPPSWFDLKYPEHLEKYAQGTETKTMHRAGPLGSELWLQTSLKMIRDVVSHVEASRYANHVFGYLCGGGQSAEWYWPGGLDGLPGYSVATRAGFQNWLREKYRDESALQRAWSTPGLSFAAAEVPAPEVRRAGENFLFRDPKQAQQEIDFREFLNVSTFHHLSESARVVKEASARKKLVFAYQGYAMSATGRAKLANNGLQNLGKVLADPNIDCVAHLIDYSKRRGGQAGLGIAPFYASARLHGKMMWEEHDYRTHVARAAEKTNDLPETLSVVQRSFGMTLAQDAGVWWRVFENDWYHQNETMETIAAMKRAGDASRAVDKSSVAQVALVYDENTPYYLTGGENAFLRAQVWGAYEGAARMGAPFDMILMDDLLDDLKGKKLPDYKLYVFLDAYRMDDATRKAIAEKVRKNNAVAVWCYAPGYMDGANFGVKAMQELTGIKLSEKREEQQLTLQVTDAKHPITKFAKPFSSYKFGPVFSVADEQAKILATTANGPALAVKEFKNWRSVYSLMPLTQEILQGLCDYAGVPVYSRSFDVLYANRGYVFLYTSSAGEKTIALPVKADVTEVLSNKVVAHDAQKFSEKLESGAARLYRIDAK